MKIYFTASSRGTEKFNKYYKNIYDLISNQGHFHTSDYSKESDPSEIYQSDDEAHAELYKRAVNQLKKADIVILEVSKHSLTMGYLLELGLNLGKPVIALHQTGYKPAFAAGIADDKLQVVEYNEGNLNDLLIDAIDYASSQQDTRFNFFVSPKHINFLDWIAQNKKIPRSVYLRRLIEKEMSNDDQYNSQQN